MPDLEYRPIQHDHDAFLEDAGKRKGFAEAYGELAKEYSLVRELLRARRRADLTQEAVAEMMGTTKSSVSRLETPGKHSPSVNTLRRYAQAVGCQVEIRLVPTSEATKQAKKPRARRRTGTRAQKKS